MTSTIRVTPDQLRSAAGRCDTAASDLRARSTRLDGNLNGLAPRWLGMSEHTFMQKYAEAKVAIVGFVAYLDGMAGFLREAARRLEAADQGVTAGAWGTYSLHVGQGSVPGQPMAVAGFTLEQGTQQSSRLGNQLTQVPQGNATTIGLGLDGVRVSEGHTRSVADQSGGAAVSQNSVGVSVSPPPTPEPTPTPSPTPVVADANHRGYIDQ